MLLMMLMAMMICRCGISTVRYIWTFNDNSFVIHFLHFCG